MSLDCYRGAAYSFRKLMEMAQADLESGGEIKPVKQPAQWRQPNLRKITIPRFWSLRKKAS